MADKERGVTLGDIARLMGKALEPIDQEIARLEEERNMILTAPSLLIPGAVAARDGKVEQAVHELNQTIVYRELASFQADHPDAAAVDVSYYLPTGGFSQLLPEQVVELPQQSARFLPPPPRGEISPKPLSGDWQEKQEQLLQKYPFLVEFFDDSRATMYQERKYFARNSVEDILAHGNGASAKGIELFISKMFNEWKSAMGAGESEIGTRLPGQGRTIGLMEEEMVGFLWFLDNRQNQRHPGKELTYHIGDPGKKKF